ncbi:MAG: hypothetical protein WC860_07465 [Candidatus Margulisiibacteriota bacterium]|jgi:hypothetical protein
MESTAASSVSAARAVSLSQTYTLKDIQERIKPLKASLNTLLVSGQIQKLTLKPPEFRVLLIAIKDKLNEFPFITPKIKLDDPNTEDSKSLCDFFDSFIGQISQLSIEPTQKSSISEAIKTILGTYRTIIIRDTSLTGTFSAPTAPSPSLIAPLGALTPSPSGAASTTRAVASSSSSSTAPPPRLALHGGFSAAFTTPSPSPLSAASTTRALAPSPFAASATRALSGHQQDHYVKISSTFTSHANQIGRIAAHTEDRYRVVFSDNSQCFPPFDQVTEPSTEEINQTMAAFAQAVIARPSTLSASSAAHSMGVFEEKKDVFSLGTQSPSPSGAVFAPQTLAPSPLGAAFTRRALAPSSSGATSTTPASVAPSSDLIDRIPRNDLIRYLRILQHPNNSEAVAESSKGCLHLVATSNVMLVHARNIPANEREWAGYLASLGSEDRVLHFLLFAHDLEDLFRGEVENRELTPNILRMFNDLGITELKDKHIQNKIFNYFVVRLVHGFESPMQASIQRNLDISKKNLDVLVALWNNAGENQNIRDKITYWFSNNNIPDLDRPLLLTNVSLPEANDHVGILQNTPIEVLGHSREFLHGFDSFLFNQAFDTFNPVVHAANQMFDFNRGNHEDPLNFFKQDIFNEFKLAMKHDFKYYAKKLVSVGKEYLKACLTEHLPEDYFRKLSSVPETRDFLHYVIVMLKREVLLTQNEAAQGVLDILAPVAIPQQKSEGKVTKEFVNAYAAEVAAVKQTVTQARPQITQRLEVLSNAVVSVPTTTAVLLPLQQQAQALLQEVKENLVHLTQVLPIDVTEVKPTEPAAITKYKQIHTLHDSLRNPSSFAGLSQEHVLKYQQISADMAVVTKAYQQLKERHKDIERIIAELARSVAPTPVATASSSSSAPATRLVTFSDLAPQPVPSSPRPAPTSTSLSASFTLPLSRALPPPLGGSPLAARTEDTPLVVHRRSHRSPAPLPQPPALTTVASLSASPPHAATSSLVSSPPDLRGY